MTTQPDFFDRLAERITSEQDEPHMAHCVLIAGLRTDMPWPPDLPEVRRRLAAALRQVFPPSAVQWGTAADAGDVFWPEDNEAVARGRARKYGLRLMRVTTITEDVTDE